MSAFVCGRRTVRDAVALLVELGEIDEVDGSLYGRRLWNLNVEAVEQRYSHRYKEDGDSWAAARKEAAAFEYRPLSKTKAQLIKSLQCLHYNMAEGNVTETKTWKWLHEIEGRASKLPEARGEEYEAAHWTY